MSALEKVVAMICGAAVYVAVKSHGVGALVALLGAAGIICGLAWAAWRLSLIRMARRLAEGHPVESVADIMGDPEDMPRAHKRGILVAFHVVHGHDAGSFLEAYEWHRKFYSAAHDREDADLEAEVADALRFWEKQGSE